MKMNTEYLEINDDKYILYYTFLKPVFQKLGGIPHGHKGITLSRTYQSICDKKRFEKIISNITSSHKILHGKFSGIINLGKNNDIPVLNVDCSDLENLHKQIMFTLLFFGSPYFGDYLYEGHANLVFSKNGNYLVENKYNPHLSLSKIQEIDLETLINSDFSFLGIYSTVKRFGKWDEPKFYKFREI